MVALGLVTWSWQVRLYVIYLSKEAGGRNQPRSPTWAAGAQRLEPQPLPPRVCISRKLHLGEEPSIKLRHSENVGVLTEILNASPSALKRPVPLYNGAGTTGHPT